MTVPAAAIRDTLGSVPRGSGTRGQHCTAHRTPDHRGRLVVAGDGVVRRHARLRNRNRLRAGDRGIEQHPGRRCRGGGPRRGGRGLPPAAASMRPPPATLPPVPRRRAPPSAAACAAVPARKSRPCSRPGRPPGRRTRGRPRPAGRAGHDRSSWSFLLVWPASPARSRKTSRSRASALWVWDFTVPVLHPSTVAVSSIERSSQNRRTRTARCCTGSVRQARSSICRSSTPPRYHARQREPPVTGPAR